MRSIDLQSLQEVAKLDADISSKGAEIRSMKSAGQAKSAWQAEVTRCRVKRVCHGRQLAFEGENVDMLKVFLVGSKQ